MQAKVTLPRVIIIMKVNCIYPENMEVECSTLVNISKKMLKGAVKSDIHEKLFEVPSKLLMKLKKQVL